MLIDCVISAGFQHPQHLVHLFVGGSTLHGAKVGDSDDLDIYGVFVQPLELIVGLGQEEHFVWSTNQKLDRKNTHSDVDICLYSLNKWARLTAKGNPMVLSFLFTQSECQNPAWKMIQDSKDLFLASSHAHAFLGYTHAQLMSFTEQRTKNVTRPELVEKYGYDTKYAMHLIRLLIECNELLVKGKITFPSPFAEDLVKIRTGHFQKQHIINWAANLEETCRQLQSKSPLPKEIDRKKVSRLIGECYQCHWNFISGKG